MLKCCFLSEDNSETVGIFFSDFSYLFNFTVRLNAGKPERKTYIFLKGFLRFNISNRISHIQKISPQIGYLVVVLHIDCSLIALIFIFLVAIHIGG